MFDIGIPILSTRIWLFPSVVITEKSRYRRFNIPRNTGIQ